MIRTNPFPDEILKEIVYWLKNPRDLINIALTDKWHLLFFKDKGIWQENIQRHFPYLVVTHQSMYQEQPKKLFQQEYQKIKEEAAKNGWSGGIPYLLASLRGEMDKVEKANLPADVKKALYLRAVANGHRRFGANVSVIELYSYLHEALPLAAENGHFLEAKRILSDLSLDIEQTKKYLQAPSLTANQQVVLNQYLERFNETIRKATIKAARNGHLNILQEMLTYLTVEGIELAIAEATECRQFKIIDNFLKINGVFKQSGRYKYFEAFASAIASYSLYDFQECLRQIDFSHRIKQYILSHAVKIGNVPVILELLRLEDTPLAWKSEALSYAAQLAQLSVVQEILKQPGLSSKDKGMVLRETLDFRNGNVWDKSDKKWRESRLAIAFLLLKEPHIPIQYLRGALKWAVRTVVANDALFIICKILKHPQLGVKDLGKARKFAQKEQEKILIQQVLEMRLTPEAQANSSHTNNTLLHAFITSVGLVNKDTPKFYEFCQAITAETNQSLNKLFTLARQAAEEGHGESYAILDAYIKHSAISAIVKGEMLEIASFYGELPAVHVLLNQTDISAEYITDALYMAATEGHEHVVRELINHVDISEMDIQKMLEEELKPGIKQVLTEYLRVESNKGVGSKETAGSVQNPPLVYKYTSGNAEQKRNRLMLSVQYCSGEKSNHATELEKENSDENNNNVKKVKRHQ